MSERHFLIVQNMVLKIGDSKFRVVYIEVNKIWVIRLDNDDWAVPYDPVILQTQVDCGDIKIIPDPFAEPACIDESSQSYKVEVRRFELLKKYVTDIKKLVYKPERIRIIVSLQSTRQTATHLIKQYLKRGMNQNALRPDFSNCGAKGKRNPAVNWKKIGAPRTISPGTGINITEEVRKQLQLGADLWLVSKDATLKTANDLVIETYYSKKLIDPNSGIAGFKTEEDKKPTVRQLQYFIKTEYPEEYTRRKRNGEVQYEINERAILGWADCTVQGPGDEFQADAAVANIPLVSQFDRRRIVGYPVIYLTTDTFSRLITGVSAGFEGPSWPGAMIVLINMVTDKVEFCRRYGITIINRQWPSQHAPKLLLADKGELFSVKLGQNIVNNLGVDIDNTPSGRPDYKAFIERRFGVVKTEFRSFAPGYVKQEFSTVPNMKDSRLKAILNIYEFMQVLIRAVLVHNMTPIRNLILPPEMVAEGLSATPLDLWNWGIANRSGSLHQLSVEKTMINVMHRDHARVTSKGIFYRGAYYKSDTSIRDEWFAKARRHEWTVEIGIEPSNLGKLLLFDKKLPRGYELCELIESNIDHTFKTLYEIEELEMAKKKNKAATEDRIQSERITQEHEIRNIISSAVKMKQQLPDTRSNTQKLSGIRDSRNEERAAQRNNTSIITNLTVTDYDEDNKKILMQEDYSTFEEDILERLNKEKDSRDQEANHDRSKKK
ncbi:DDE-type integrase/transposase/recombinase [Geomonas ferrireducens]|uniref:DDE-type integrase/transposase/recombinase n=1 Tax=Geomonas ferrireducens TaxID=2570227 RepID=UPI0010A83B2D|nr:DDE-type integrase/transposase/recombinase [Geomonas ferrireducens]